LEGTTRESSAGPVSTLTIVRAPTCMLVFIESKIRRRRRRRRRRRCFLAFVCTAQLYRSEMSVPLSPSLSLSFSQRHDILRDFTFNRFISLQSQNQTLRRRVGSSCDSVIGRSLPERVLPRATSSRRDARAWTRKDNAISRTLFRAPRAAPD